MKETDLNGLEVAVIGMSGRFPGAENISEFRENLTSGVETISFFSDRELEEAGIPPGILKNPAYIKARGILENKDFFDASFFGYTPNEAEIMDPQMRIFHECAWEALEDAGYDPRAYRGLIGFYAGASSSFYWEALSLLSGKNNTLGDFETSQLTDKDFICSKISFKLDLKGPALSVQTACSTSLAAIHTACQALLNAECDMALAGGITVTFTKKSGYLYREGMINSADGHCRTFDAGATGTVGGEGAGIVVLKRYEDAAAAGDHIYALVKGSALNNDGSEKVGFTAPGVKGQAQVIRTALQMAEIEPESIEYVEAHGTGTILGDPVEIEALKQGFSINKKNFCALGSVKTNMGHLDCAAGVTGFIKTVLALTHRFIPPSLHFTTPNPKVDFDNSPFYVNSRLKQWETNKGGTPRRAGVSSFGIGGTNAHVILEEPPPSAMVHPSPDIEEKVIEENKVDRQYQLILLSARSETALEQMTKNLAKHFKLNPGLELAEAAYTLQVGRRRFPFRKMCVCADIDDAISNLSGLHPDRVNTFVSDWENPPVIFMFPGQGAQVVNMGLELYRTYTRFREEMDRCFAVLHPLIEYDIKAILYPGESVSEVRMSDQDTYMSHINQTEIAQPLLFIFEYALAKLLMEWGILPHALIGHSIGEYTAACLSGVFSLEDALKLVVLRGKLMQQMPTGAMLSVPMSCEQLVPLLPGELSLAAINTASSCVVSGPGPVIDAFETQINENINENSLKEKGYKCKRLHTSHAFHSPMMDPVLNEFRQAVSKATLNEPRVPFISNVTGNWIPVEDATNPAYWASHLRKTVRFADGIDRLLKEEQAVFLEIGPGSVLSTFVRQNEHKTNQHQVLNLVGNPRDQVPDVRYLTDRIGQLWLYGKSIDWGKFYAESKRHRISLPTYPFERQQYWLEGNPFRMGEKMLSGRPRLSKNPNISNWFYLPSWKQSRILDREKQNKTARTWLIFNDETGLGRRLVQRLQQENQEMVREMIRVTAGADFVKQEEDAYMMNPANASHYDKLFAALNLARKIPVTIVHLWNVSEDNGSESMLERLDREREMGFYSLIYLAQALGKLDITDTSIKIIVVTNNLHDVNGEENLSPGKALILGPSKVIPGEYPNITCRAVDILLPTPETQQYEILLEALLAEIMSDASDRVTALRGRHRWAQDFESVKLDKTSEISQRTREKGVYLITGGLGGIGFVLARHLARSVKARLILLGRSAFPAREGWNKWLSEHDDQDPAAVRIREILEMEKHGARILVFSADAADPEQMKDVITRSIREFGHINGVIHGAGVPDGGLIQLKTRQHWEKILAPKFDGTVVLDSILKEMELDFFVLCSSLSSVLSPVGQVAYCSANAFLDAYAHHKTARGTFTVSINWDAWQEVGMAAGAVHSLEELKDAILPPEGIDVFNRVLDRTLPQVLVSTINLKAVMEMPRNPGSTKKGETGAVPEPASKSPAPRRPRPALTTPYKAPGNETEQTIAAIWEDIFGFGPLGIYDNFFQLGGDSVKALHASTRLKNAGIDIPVHKLILHQTIKNICSEPVPGQAPQPLSDASDKGLKDTVTEEMEREIETKLRQNSQLTPLLKENLKIDEYPVSPIQRFYLVPPYTGISRDIILFSYHLTGPRNSEKIKEIIIKLINKNSLLRSVIKYSDKGYHIETYDSFPNIQYPFIDISGFSIKGKEKVLDIIYAILYQPFDVIDGLLYRLILVKFDNTDNTGYRLIFAFNHLIFDGQSVGILTEKIDRLSRSGKNNSNIDETQESANDANDTNDYKDYTHFLEVQEYEDIHLEKFLDLPAYIKYIEKAVQTFNVGDMKYDGFQLDLSLLEDHLKGFYNEIILLAFARLIGLLFHLEKAPVLFVTNGRTYKDGHYANVIGDFHDRIPLLLPGGRDMEMNPGLIIRQLIDYRRYTRDHNLNFTNFFFKNPYTGNDHSKLFSPFSFNSLIGSYEHFKGEQDNEIRRKLIEKKLLSSSAIFQISLIEDFQSDKVEVSFWQNSNLKINEIKECFIKNYNKLVDTLNSGFLKD